MLIAHLFAAVSFCVMRRSAQASLVIRIFCNVVLLGSVTLTSAGCGCGFYKITDLRSGEGYYMKGCPWLLHYRSGAIEFHELSSGDDIILQDSRITRVTQEEAQSHLKRQAQLQSSVR
jgi:hypothetical protein